jgi:hypothetical protein
MEMINKALVWYPDRTVKLARMWRCAECGMPIVLYANQIPDMATTSCGQHGHIVVSGERELCRCLEFAGDDPECLVHGAVEIPVIFRD